MAVYEPRLRTFLRILEEEESKLLMKKREELGCDMLPLA
jgi:hypothetical protein